MLSVIESADCVNVISSIFCPLLSFTLSVSVVQSDKLFRTFQNVPEAKMPFIFSIGL